MTSSQADEAFTKRSSRMLRLYEVSLAEGRLTENIALYHLGLRARIRIRLVGDRNRNALRRPLKAPNPSARMSTAQTSISLLCLAPGGKNSCFRGPTVAKSKEGILPTLYRKAIPAMGAWPPYCQDPLRAPVIINQLIYRIDRPVIYILE